MPTEGLPLLLTVEEAGELLRIGRTKAYAMAREWRETEGRSGLPVIDLGHVLRVPRRASAEPSQPPANVPSEEPPAQRPATTDRSRRCRESMANQLDLFDTEPAAS